VHEVPRIDKAMIALATHFRGPQILPGKGPKISFREEEADSTFILCMYCKTNLSYIALSDIKAVNTCLDIDNNNNNIF
jgi:hypothetical protein